MVHVLKRTMVLDISDLLATLGRFEIAKAVDDLYCEDFVVKSVQFMPGKRQFLMHQKLRTQLNSLCKPPSMVSPVE